MEGGDLAESEEEEEEEARGTTVLWEKCFQQSIIVDLSDDESLHFSDLDASLALHLNQADSPASATSIHLSGSTELSALEDSSSESSVDSSRSERVAESRRSGLTHKMVYRPNTRQDRPPPPPRYEDSGQNTSDEDQDDLPYDGALSSPYFNQMTTTDCTASPDGRDTVRGSPDSPGPDGNDTRGGLKKPEEDGTIQENSPDASPSCPLGINQLLLRHFTQEELQQPGRLIDAETLPEVSLLESVTSTIRSLMLTHNGSAAMSNDRSENPETISERTNDATSKSSPGQETEKETSSVSTHSGELHSAADTGKSGDAEQVFRFPLVRTGSFCEMKYGQGQVHYPLPDFSKVAPRVKIPRAPSGPTRPARPSPCTMHRAQSSPGMLDLISRVLEDSIPQPPRLHVFPGDVAPDHLQHATELKLHSNCDDEDADLRNLTNGSHLGSSAPQLPQSDNFSQKHETLSQTYVRVEAEAASCDEPEEAVSVSDGDRMTAELRDIVSLFVQRVDEFSASVSNMAINTEEQQMMLRSMMEAQEQLERKYMSSKEEHRALEMQNYMGLSRNTGTFDPDRLVEGDIFRIGMHLDNIKEMIDRNVCEQMSPPPTSSTPTSINHMSGPVHMFTPSLPPSPRQASCAGFSTESFEVGTRPEIEEELEEEDEDITEQRDDEAEPASEIITEYNNCHSCSEEGADVQRDRDDDKEEEEEGSSLFSEGNVRCNFLAQLSRSRSNPKLTDWTAERYSTTDEVHIPEDDGGDGLSLAVEVSASCPPAPKYSSDTHRHPEPTLRSPCFSQTIVSAETDSGFGSTYLSQSASGSHQPSLTTERTSHSDAPSSSDSEGSCSILQTTVHQASLSVPGWDASVPAPRSQLCGAAAAVDLWVESTTKEPSIRRQGCDAASPELLSHCVSESAISATMDLEERTSQANSCSCNSEAILALQSEVSRLKKDLQDGLVQLPHLTQKMDYLTTKYRQDRQERRSRNRGRTHLRASHSDWETMNKVQTELSPSPTRTEDWISSDMDPSRSKGTDSDDAGSDIMLQFHTSPAGSRRGSSVRLEAAEFQYKAHGTQHSRKEGNGPIRRSGLGSTVTHDVCERPTEKRPTTGVVGNLYPSDRWAPLSSLSPRRPLLQVGYGSSSSLPASYKVREPPQPWSHRRKRSTQSDTALLPSNVFFQGTLSPVSASSRAVSRTGRRRASKEDDISRTLDQAIEVALGMKRTTDRMAKRLSADLAEAQHHRRLYNRPPTGGNKH